VDKQECRASAASIQIVTDKLTRVMQHFGPQRDTQTLTDDDIKEYIIARRKHVYRGRPISDATIRKEIGRLFEALRFAKRKKKWAGEIEQLRMPRMLAPDQPKKRYLREAEYIAILEHIPIKRRDYIVMWCHTGARYSELFRIEAQHIDESDPSKPRVYLTGRKGRVEYKERWVPLSADALEIVTERAKRFPTGPLFPDLWHNTHVRKALAKACQRVGVPPCSPNDLRRTFATWYGRVGKKEDLKAMMGHSPSSKLVDHVYRQLHADTGYEQIQGFPARPPMGPPPYQYRRRNPINPGDGASLGA
jgi:integrase